MNVKILELKIIMEIIFLLREKERERIYYWYKDELIESYSDAVTRALSK